MNRIGLSLGARTAGAGVVLVAVTMTTAFHAIGPAVRSLLGAPADYGSDYMSAEALRQALVLQILTGTVGFLAFGYVTDAWRREEVFRWGTVAANPLTVGAGYWLYRAINPNDIPTEYSGYLGAVVLSLIGPLVMAPAAFLGVRLRRRHRRDQ